MLFETFRLAKIPSNSQTFHNVKNSFKKVVEILKVEADAIERAAERLSEKAVEKSLGFLSSCEGKIVVLGVGKSGVIAQKISQTLTSTGTVAIFCSPI